MSPRDDTLPLMARSRSPMGPDCWMNRVGTRWASALDARPRDSASTGFKRAADDKGSFRGKIIHLIVLGLLVPGWLLPASSSGDRTGPVISRRRVARRAPDL